MFFFLHRKLCLNCEVVSDRMRTCPLTNYTSLTIYKGNGNGVAFISPISICSNALYNTLRGTLTRMH